MATRRLRFLWIIPLLLVLLLLSLPVAAQETKGETATAPGGTTPYITITSAGPLTEIFLGVDASTQIAYAGDTAYQVYPPSTRPGDYGTFIVTGDTLYAPDFVNHGGTATGSLGPYTPFSPVSQTGVTGSGTSADPYRVVTVVDVGTTGLRVTQTDSYVVGQEAYRTDVEVTNNGAAAQGIILYRAMDCYLGLSDTGYGDEEPTTGAVACTKTANNTPPDRIEQLLPLSAGSSYYEAGYSEVWGWIGTKTPFPSTCECDTFQDNGAGISWTATVPAGETITRSHLTTFSPQGSLPLTMSKVADAPTSTVGTGNGYTITINNPNSVAVTVTSITDELPAGFSYVAGSTTGATTDDPAIAGQTLTWTGAFSVPANGTIDLSFNVIVSDTPGTYYNNASAEATDYTVAPTGDTAPIVVEESTSVTLSQFDSDQPGREVLWLALAGLALAGLALVFRRR